MAQSQIGCLVPLTQNLDEDTSIPKLTLAEGPNVIGRNSVPLPDIRLSRKHLTLTAAVDGTADLFVEGTNPVVVNSGNKRKKLSSRESISVVDGDIIELIPGDHLFKFVTRGGHKNAPSLGNDEPSRKRSRQTEPQEQGTAVEVESSRQSQSKSESTEKAIQHFHVPHDKLSSTFRLLRVNGLPDWANTSCLSIGDVIQGDVLIAILSNYMIDIDWLLPACPILTKIPHVLVVHGEGDGTLDHMKRNKPANWILHKPPLPISYGTHHSKAMLLVYPRGVRIIIHTANLMYVDWNNKSQGLWMQDFPWKDQNSPSKGCGFEHDLIDYLSSLKWPEFSVNIPALGNCNINPAFFKKFDYSEAAVRLIASVPGYHTGTNLKKWGHMKLRTVLQDCTFDKEFKNSPLVYQFSSLGSLDEKWLAELASSMSSGFSEDKTSLGPGQPRIIWPTVEDVRCSLEGYAAGNCIPSPLKNVEKEFLKKYWAKWKASHTGRCRAMPHIKTYARYNGQKLAWLLLTSANLSKAAWGALQKNGSQLMIRSYELGVLFLPSYIGRHGSGFSCTGDGDAMEFQHKDRSSENSEVQRTNLVTLTYQRSKNSNSSSEVIPLPVPYELPPQPYTSEGHAYPSATSVPYGVII